MGKNRLEAFSDGVLAVVITVMVLELKAKPDSAEFADLKPLIPAFTSYVMSFLYVGIYWNNHHHMFHSTKHVTGGILWANLHLLFWLSLFPFTTAWVGENHLAPVPTAVYGFVLLMAGTAYYILQRAIISEQGPDSLLKKAIGTDWKGKMSPLLYLAAIPLAFVSSRVANGIYLLVALIWLVPDRRIERVLAKHQGD
jgi:TMEM175 potassium channel family protein